MHISCARSGSWLRLAACALAAALAACGDSPSDSVVPVPARLDIVSGNTQQTVVGTELPDPLVVRVTDDRGKPVAGQVVNFRVVSGGGSVFAGTAQTNAQGEARERWTLGTSTAAADSQRLEVRAVDPTTGAAIVFASFSATARPAPAAAVDAGNGARTGRAGATLADSVSVRVSDKYGNPVPGQTVTWTVTSGGGTVSATASTTDASGIARAAWTLGTRVGEVQALAVTVGSLPAAAINATVTSGPAATLQKTAGDGGTAGVNSSRTLRAHVADQYGNPVIGQVINWGVQSGGGMVGSSTSTTDAMGNTVMAWTLGATPGTQSVTAAVAGAPAVTGTYTVTAVAILAKQSGDRATATVGSANTLEVRVTDSGGTPVWGYVVRWEVTRGGGSVNVATSTTDTRGIATAIWEFGTVPGQQSLTASAPGAEGSPLTYSTMAVAGAPEALRFRVQPSDSRLNVPISPQVQVELLDAYGNLSTSGSYSVNLNAVQGSAVGWIKESPTGTHVTAVSSGGVAVFPSVSITMPNPQPATFRLSAFMFHPSGTGNFSALSNSFNVTP